MPMSTMSAGVSVTAIDNNSCVLRWSCQAKEKGVSAEKGEAMIKSLYINIMKAVAKQFD